MLKEILIVNMHIFRIVFLLCITGFQLKLLAQTATASEQPSFFDTLASLPLEKLVLHGPLDSAILEKYTDREYPAQLTVQYQGGEINLPLKLSVRSRSRRRYCTFPPLKFNFVKGDLEAMGLSRQDDYKIVTHCIEEPVDASHLRKEKMIYDIYQELSPASLRAIWVDLEYHCTVTDSNYTKPVILLESFAELASRQEGEPCDCMGTSKDSIDAFQYELVAMLQYMIGNADMDYKVERNVRLIKYPDGRKWLPIAYDFDYACLVNAPYVYPQLADNRSIRTKYLGIKEHADQLPDVKNHFIERKDNIIDLVKKYPGLSSTERRLCLQYIRAFYRDIENKDFYLSYKD